MKQTAIRKSFDYSTFEAEAIEALKSGKPLTSKDGIVTPLIKRILEAALEGEIEAHLAQSDVPNRRNGKTKKTVQSSHGPVELATPRDREGSFDPQIVKKRQTVLNESLTVLVSNVLHIDISNAFCKISHGPRPVFESRGSNLSLRAYETILKEVCQSHGYGFSNMHPQFQFLFVSLTFCPAFVGMTQ